MSLCQESALVKVSIIPMPGIPNQIDIIGAGDEGPVRGLFK
jgi:hypothetical protein